MLFPISRVGTEPGPYHFCKSSMTVDHHMLDVFPFTLLKAMILVLESRGLPFRGDHSVPLRKFGLNGEDCTGQFNVPHYLFKGHRDSIERLTRGWLKMTITKEKFGGSTQY